MKVKVLPSSLADKIAAGEVVERPASVVKELVENALDAGAENISVEIKRGGVTFIRVTDDGCGMRPEDAKTAFLRHATSKIAEVDDLNNIATYGFRGEALAAICAVSKVELITSTDSAQTAFYLMLEGGEITQEDEIGAPVGTSIIVRDLFYNTPARLHFLKKDSTEAAAVTTMLERMAIARHDVSFTLISDQKVVLRTTKSDDMKNAIHAVFGSTISDSLLKVSFEYKDTRLDGYVCKPNVTRSNRNMQMTFLNGRYIKSKLIYHGIDEAYRSFQETSKRPVCFLNYTVNPQEVDVNVHPAKLEVKFRDDKTIIVLTKYGVLDALEADTPFYEVSDAASTPSADDVKSDGYSADRFEYGLAEKSKDLPIYDAPPPPKPMLGIYDSSGAFYIPDPPGIEDTFEAFAIEIDSEDEQEDLFSAQFTSETIPATAKESPIESPSYELAQFEDLSQEGIPQDMRILGEIFKVYFVIEYRDVLYLVDKHAAHEKIIYNKLVQEMLENNNVSAQTLLSPIVIVLPAEDLDLVLNHAISFYKAGFDFYESGPDRISLSAVPTVLPGVGYTEAFLDLLEAIRKNKSGITDYQEKMLKIIACRAAIKGGDECYVEEILPLVSKLITEKDVSYCPHGRPVIQSFTHKEIDKMFKRIK